MIIEINNTKKILEKLGPSKPVFKNDKEALKFYEDYMKWAEELNRDFKYRNGVSELDAEKIWVYLKN